MKLSSARFKRTVLGAIVLFVLAPAAVQADVRLPAIFADNMVLQRDMEVPVWGWADPGETVTISFGGQDVQAKANEKGEFSAKLPAMSVNRTGQQLKVSGSSEVTCDNVLVGEVWLASGQSNMEWPVQRADNAEVEIGDANYPDIRFFHIPHVVSGTPVSDVKATWQECSPETVKGFSAVAYFFGRELYMKLNVPVGLIDSSWGGTRIEPWTPPAGFAKAGLDQISTQIEEANKKYEDMLAGDPDEAPKHPLAENNRQPTALYNGMVHGIVPYGIRGAIWYQGESNRGEGMEYFKKMDALIAGWREIWGEGDFPFYFVQLAPFKYGGSETALPEIWEAQTAALTAIANTGMAVTVDVGNVADIHPTNKQEVGRRLALWALAKEYDEDLVYSGPIFSRMDLVSDKILLMFDHAGSGLTTSDGQPPSHFQVAGEDGRFVDAQVKIEGKTILVWADSVPVPKHARYAWHQEAEPNLINKEGLPASPFRTQKPRIVRGEGGSGR